MHRINDRAVPWISFDAATCAAVPWRNGGGTTCELLALVASDATGAEANHAFDARVSLATIAQPGPFSAFPGIDRQITLLDGRGVRLAAQDGAVDHRLEQALVPFAFDGGIALDAAWADGGAGIAGGDGDAARVLNVMTRRGRCHATVEIMTTSATLGEASPSSNRKVTLHLVARGAWRVAGPGDAVATATLTAGQGAYSDSRLDALPDERSAHQEASHMDSRLQHSHERAASLHLAPLTPGAALIVVRITFLAAP